MEDKRRLIIQFIFIGVGLVFAIKLFFLQVLDDSYQQAAANNALLKKVVYPYRGLIYDRKGRLLVYNVPVYDILVTPRDLPKNLDTARVAELFRIPLEEARTRLREARAYSRVKPSVFVKQMSAADFARIQDQLVDFPGFADQPRTMRGYDHTAMASALGYISEISKTKLENPKYSYYKQGDYLGTSGLESYYEEYLRGKRGVEFVMVDVHGIQKGRFRDGAFDTVAVKGTNLYSSIDLELQKYGEKLMQGKAGSVVAIEPNTGEILSFINAPTYDPNLLTGRELSKNFYRLQKDSTLPLFNRPLMAMYPPGSIFKLLQALIGQEEGVIDSTSTFPCDQSVVKCHRHPNPQALKGAIQYSCNPYFLRVFRKIVNRDQSPNTFVDTRLGYKVWRDYIESFGVGIKLGIDLPNEKPGILKKYTYFDKVYGENRWKFSNIYSLSIGQGEVGIVPLQMANIAAIIANRGYYYTPHFIKRIGEGREARIKQKFLVRHQVPISPHYFDIIADGMEGAVANGTVMGKARLKGVSICGKTGTAQNPHGEDHSVFICFAPKENPKIAMAVFVENAGFGGLFAAPIATLMIEKYLNDTISRPALEEYILSKNLLATKSNAYNTKRRTGRP